MTHVDESVSDLRSSFAGTILASADPGYHAARICFYALVHRRPALIARCVGADDVATNVLRRNQNIPPEAASD